MSYKNVLFLKNKANINDLSALSNFDPKIRIKEINNVTLPNEMNSFQSYIFDELHANGGISQMNFNSEEIRTISNSDKVSKGQLYGMLSKSFQNEHEALKIKFIIFYVIVFLGYEMIGITAVDNSNDCYEFDFYDYGIKYLSVWDLSTDSLLNLPQNTILMIQ